MTAMATSSCRLRCLPELSLTNFPDWSRARTAYAKTGHSGIGRATVHPTPGALELDAACQGAVHDEVLSRDEAFGPACKKHHGIRHLLRRTHAAGRVEGQRGLVQFGIVVLDRVPDPALEIGVARRHRIGADTLGGQLVGQTLRIMDDRGLEGPIGATCK